MQTIGPLGEALAAGRNVLSAKHLTLASVKFLRNIARNLTMDADSRAAGADVFLQRK